jgi:7-cyano-7-deazaguanine reductase
MDRAQIKEKISKLKCEFTKVSAEMLEAMPYEYAGKDIEVDVETDEFTCLCPWSGLPDFATVRICYVPAKTVVELKSLKFYLQSYRMVGMVHESVVNLILKDLVACVKPKRMNVEIIFAVRGGITTTVRANYIKR